MKNWQALTTFLVVRLVSVFLVQTWYVADEYWQSLEVAHKLIFGYGELTWEWKLGIRSYVYPLLIGFLYKILQIIGLDYVTVLITLPRIMQAILSAYADYRFFLWSGHKKWAVFIMSTSYFWYYTGSRTLINSFETTLTTIILSYFPWPDKINKHENINKFIWILGILCVIRPTAIIPWIPLCLYHFKTSDESILNLLFARYFPIGLTILLSSIMIDTYGHGSLIVTPYEFIKVNIFQGISGFYGSNPWHWYLSNGIPVVLGVNFIPFILATYQVLKNRYISQNELVLLGSIVFTTAILSTISHKEYRFILPILPMALHLIVNFLAKWSFKAEMIFIWIVSGSLLIGNALPAYYLGLTHQRGPLDVMESLHEIASKNPHNSSFVFLMPCHSTPLYSHIHVNVPIKYLTCLPNFENVNNYRDVAEIFYDNPAMWVKANYPPTSPLPSHIIIFDVTKAFLTDILSRYKLIKQVFHADVVSDRRHGRYILIYEVVKLNKTVVTAT